MLRFLCVVHSALVERRF